MFKDKVSAFIEDKRLFSQSDKILVALSGGADSVALLLILQQLGYHVVAAHCNFHLRGEESMRDESFVRDLCKQLNVPFLKTDFQTEDYAKLNNISIEMAARDLRYNWFSELIEKGEGNVIAIGHHKNDNVETLLLNLIRGTGLRGLTAIQPKNEALRRPLLCVSREDIVSFLAQEKQNYVTDSTNLEDEFARNKIRLNILPQMQEINNACINNMDRTIQHLNETHLIYKEAIEEAKARVVDRGDININKLLQEVSPQTILFELLNPIGFNSSQVSDIFNTLTQGERKVFYSNTHTIVKSRDTLILSRLVEQEDIVNSTPTLEIEIVENTPSFKITPNLRVAYVDADKVDINKLNLKKWEDGDYFIPFGMKGRKKISDYFIDEKYTENEKKNQWLLTYKGDIIWVVNKRSDNRFRISKETTRIAIIKVKE